MTSHDFFLTEHDVMCLAQGLQISMQFVTPDRKPWSSDRVAGRPFWIPTLAPGEAYTQPLPGTMTHRTKQPETISPRDIKECIEQSFDRRRLEAFSGRGYCFGYDYKVDKADGDDDGDDVAKCARRMDRKSIEEMAPVMEKGLMINRSGVWKKTTVAAALKLLEKDANLSLSTQEGYMAQGANWVRYFKDIRQVQANSTTGDKLPLFIRRLVLLLNPKDYDKNSAMATYRDDQDATPSAMSLASSISPMKTSPASPPRKKRATARLIRMESSPQSPAKVTIATDSIDAKFLEAPDDAIFCWDWAAWEPLLISSELFDSAEPRGAESVWEEDGMIKAVWKVNGRFVVHKYADMTIKDYINGIPDEYKMDKTPKKAMTAMKATTPMKANKATIPMKAMKAMKRVTAMPSMKARKDTDTADGCSTKKKEQLKEKMKEIVKNLKLRPVKKTYKCYHSSVFHKFTKFAEKEDIPAAAWKPLMSKALATLGADKFKKK